VVAANMLMRLPDSIPFDVGAALTVQPLTGYHAHTLDRDGRSLTVFDRDAAENSEFSLTYRNSSGTFLDTAGHL
jgi:hypothetical protein